MKEGEEGEEEYHNYPNIVLVAAMNSNSVGEFREGEIDGNPFLIYTLLSQTENPSSREAAVDSDGGTVDDLSVEPLILCPTLRLKVKNLKPYTSDSDRSFFPLVVSSHFPTIQSGHQQPEYMLQSYSCKLPLLPLFWCDNKNPNIYDFICRACTTIEQGTSYYVCVTCGDQFHKECVGAPLEFKHPFYPSLSLQLYSPPSGRVLCSCCQKPIYGMNYYCPTSNFTLHLFCAFKPIPFVIDHPKRHPHPLTFFPKQSFLPCHVCSLIKKFIPTYICIRCAFVVHQDCIYFPYVIKISRHHHRISYTSSLSSGKWSCGVCRQEVDNDYGAYSCNKCDDYFVHSRCALRRDIWDGIELEGVPEELEIIVEPFITISDGIILHFSHGHHLKLDTSKAYDENKLCQACTLPIYEGGYYSGVDECDFILHEACANAPCKKYHALNPYPLTLKVVTNEYHDNKGRFRCDACQRESCGFVYVDDFRGCYADTKDYKFKIDIRCASVSEPFDYLGHEHPLYLALNPEEEESAICHICQESKDESFSCKKLNCIECDFVICFKCATLPYKARYQHDKHFLKFYEAKEANDHSEWCDVCERRIADLRKKGFYSCDDCCTTLHIDCLLGEDMYMKPGHTIMYNMTGSRKHYQKKLHIHSNNTLSRPFCSECGERCRQKIVFEYKEKYIFCAVSCQKLVIDYS
ncbi:Cysteine/Histidine-rich C1 domain family protein [Arabidopsis thaliana]|nr:Cysteine/Histidine-rich C1 domain family protein [Arabidopsis thaliana]ANM58044.1 Cysteine/Histidine-rich C1 domain family protein [Arabidopsis thaliana]|eukprot:NP_001320510.1 Cysteine/Histidine-rich C1 domain family protein [Arabidopsis thaliana]